MMIQTFVPDRSDQRSHSAKARLLLTQSIVPNWRLRSIPAWSWLGPYPIHTGQALS
jgi:hypothetical protein